jgi:hypothetical protein
MYLYIYICTSHKWYTHYCRHNEAGSLSGQRASLVCGIFQNQISTRNRMIRNFFVLFRTASNTFRDSTWNLTTVATFDVYLI